MQDLVGIVRVESEMQQALDAIGQLRDARRAGRHSRKSRVQQWLAHDDRYWKHDDRF